MSYLSGPKWYLRHKNSKMYKNLEEKQIEEETNDQHHPNMI
jgi:hypothetical protein